MVRTFLLLAWTWTRAAMEYPATIALLTVGVMVSSSLDLAAILVLFTHMRTLGGLDTAGAMLLYGSSQMSFGLSNLLIGAVDRLGQHIRQGTLDTMLIRPVSPLIQLATEDFTPRKLGRLVPAVAVLAWGGSRAGLGPPDVLLTVLMVANGTLLFCAVWVLSASLQFVLINGYEATKAITWGGSFATQYPMSLYGRDFVLGVTFAVPLAFVNWQPVLYILDLPDPLGLPVFVRFLGPAATALLCAVAAVAWRTGLRHYRSTGS